MIQGMIKGEQIRWGGILSCSMCVVDRWRVMKMKMEKVYGKGNKIGRPGGGSEEETGEHGR